MSGDNATREIGASCKWAQRQTTIFLRFEILDSKDANVEFVKDKIVLTANSSDGKTKYRNEFVLFKPIDVESSGFQIKARSIDCLVFKEGHDSKKNPAGWWPRMTKEKLKIHWLGVDFGRWRDEDDSDDEGPGNFDQDFDFSKLMNQKGGLNNKDGDFDPNNINMDDLDSDDDDIPGVEDAE